MGSNLALAAQAAFPGAEIVSMDNLHRRGSELNIPRLTKAGIQFHQGDVRHRDGFPPGPFDFLFECSAEPSVLAGQEGSPDYLLETNLGGAYQCLQKARQWRSGFLFLSTSRVYPVARLEAHSYREEATRFAWNEHGTPGLSQQGVSENLEMSGARSLYGFTKLAAEQLIEEYRAAFGLKAVVNRCGVIAGPGQFGKVDQGVIAHWVMSHHFGRPLQYIGYGGAGKQVRDVLHVDDLCELLLEQTAAFDQWEGWNGNVSGGLANSVSLCELTAICQEVVGQSTPIKGVAANRPFDLRVFVADCARLFARSSWRPKRNVRRMVEDIAAWVRQDAAALAKLHPL